MALPTPDRNVTSAKQKKIARLDLVSKLYKNGWSIRKIRDKVVEELGIRYSHDSCWRDINALLDEWRQSRIENMDMALQLELERIDGAVVELWEQWERSKIDFQKRMVKKKAKPGRESTGSQARPNASEIETVDQNIQMLGDPAYIAEIRAQLIERRKLLGLYKPEKREVTGKDGSPLNPDKVDIRLDEFTQEEREQLLKIARKIGTDEV